MEKQKFKPFDRVLVRGNDSDFWIPDFYSWGENGYHYTIGAGMYDQCIPYEGNEELAGTMDAPKTTEKKPREMVEEDETYYFIRIRLSGNILIDNYSQSNDTVDNEHFKTGNYFKSRAQAMKYIERFIDMMQNRELD